MLRRVSGSSGNDGKLARNFANSGLPVLTARAFAPNIQKSRSHDARVLRNAPAEPGVTHGRKVHLNQEVELQQVDGLLVVEEVQPEGEGPLAEEGPARRQHVALAQE
jgi:hypothetical protein